MKKKKTYIEFNIVYDEETNESQTARIYTEDMRQQLKVAKEQGAEGIEIQIKGKKDVNLKLSIAQVKKFIKQAELTVNFIPKSLSNYLVDVTQLVSQKKRGPLKGRKHEIEKSWFYLSQETRNNVFLIGEKDVGKTTIAFEMVRQIADGEAPKEFFDARVLLLKPEAVLSIENEFMYKHVVKKIIEFLIENKANLILYIDKSIYMKTDYLLAVLLNKCIVNHSIPVILTSSVENYCRYFEDDPTISKYVNYVYVEEPELDELYPMIKNHIRGLKKRYKIGISEEMIKFGIFTSSLSESVSANPGNVINIFDRAFLEAKRKEKENVDKKCILSCYNSYLKLYNSMSTETKRITAYHETGHYIAYAMSNMKDMKIAFVSILPMMDFMGVNSFYQKIGENVVYTKGYFIDDIVVNLGGRVGESIITSEYSSGASGDLQHVNNCVRKIIFSYGMSENRNSKNRAYDGIDLQYMPECKKEAIDKEIQDIINEAYEKAEKIIAENRELLETIAEKLLIEEILTGEELEKICDEYKKRKNEK